MCGDNRNVVEECAPDGIICACFVVEVVEDGCFVHSGCSESVEFACIKHGCNEAFELYLCVAEVTGSGLR